MSAGLRQTVFFGDRGAYQYKGYGVMDLATSYNVPVWRTLKPWVKLEVYNLFNNQKLIAWDTAVTADGAGAKDGNGLPLDYVKGVNFGKGTSNAHYPRPRPGMDGGRTFIVAAGVRF